MGIVYRAERKRIVRSQIHLINLIINVVTSCANPLSKQEFNGIVLNKTEIELSIPDEEAYWYRRLVNAEYFRQLFLVRQQT
jgi:hypothetical protein